MNLYRINQCSVADAWYADLVGTVVGVLVTDSHGHWTRDTGPMQLLQWIATADATPINAAPAPTRPSLETLTGLYKAAWQQQKEGEFAMSRIREAITRHGYTEEQVREQAGIFPTTRPTTCG